jgi:hypothetical protein
MEIDGGKILGQPADGVSGRNSSVVFQQQGDSSLLSSMKISWLIIALAGLSAAAVLAQVPPYQVTERGANHRVWQRTAYEPSPVGKPILRIHQYTELAPGLHFLQNGEWVESKEQINILPDGTAAATNGQHQVYFPGDIYQGVIELVTPEGKLLKSRPLGLSYDDGTKTVLIATLKPSVGQLASPNQVIYPDAFTDIKADVRYTYTRAGFEQDIILREQFLTPASWGAESGNDAFAGIDGIFRSADTNNCEG